MSSFNKYDVIVVGAGHAGIEAALAAARTGLDTALFTMSLDAIGNMPCNPSIGGSGKGHLVFEIDALGGEMGYAADLATMQSRTLNTGKGAAVRSKRVQADRRKYSALMKHTIELTPHLSLIQGEVTRVIVEKCSNGSSRVVGIEAKPGGEYFASAVIMATGTYPSAKIFIGDFSRSAGPDSMLPASEISASLAEAGVSLMRFKTGTPPRILRSSIDFSELELQEGEEYITPFSARTDEAALNSLHQDVCHVVYTNAETHKIIRDNLHRSPLYGGKIHGTGPRYCPSIEDKVVRFADKERHQLFVEPMGRDTEEIYLQGFSSSLPDDVQYEMLHSLHGFENARIMRYAYAIEYDCCDPLQLKPTLEFRNIEGLYGAGQFNGTSGYEEAAAQGLVAGINASLKLRGMPEMILPRDSSYIGTLIDDLVTKGTNEPYRIMTSRSEYRLLLRQDNADERLKKYGRSAGLIDDEAWNAHLKKYENIDREKTRLEHKILPPSPELAEFLTEAGTSAPVTGISLADLLRRPQLNYEMISRFDKDAPILTKQERETVQTDIKYAGYIKRQLDEAARQRKLESKLLPKELDYSKIRGLRLEAAQKLNMIKPESIGRASRISGVNPADITVLLIYLSEKHSHDSSSESI